MLSRDITFTAEFLLESIRAICERPFLLLKIDEIRTNLALRRLNSYKENVGLQMAGHATTDSEDMIDNTIRHNLENCDPRIASFRPFGLLGPLVAMDQVLFNIDKCRVLIIGPRTEAEILWYISMGFSAQNIHGLDLFSYSDFIETGDMHQLGYSDNSFDIVVFSWVLGYSKNQKKAIAEATRVVKDAGLIAIGEQWDPTQAEDISQKMLETRGYGLEGTVTRAASDLITLFDGSTVTPRFINEPLPSQKERVGHISVIVQVSKL
jgi:hypothetical protein